MNRLISVLLILMIFGCNSISEKKKSEINERSELKEKVKEENEEWNFKKHLDNEIEYPLKKLNRKPISELKSETLRIWRFPGGGAVFEQMLEFNKSNSELTFHSYLIEDFEYEKENQLSKLNFSKKISEKRIISELKSIISDSEFIETEDSEKYCEPFLGCADVYLVEFTNGNKTNKFIINHNFEKCDNKKADNSKKIFKIMNEII
ncbi:hypothetical protein [Aquimarina brevivitae]|nr:hypothetical protein [Aquimarina brevivitae]